MEKNIKITNYIRPVIITTILVFSFVSVSYSQISVIVSKSSSQTASKEEIIEFFNGARLNWSNGDKVSIVDQVDSDVGKSFYSDFLATSLNKVRKKWTKLVLSGQANAPTKVSNDDEVKSTVAKSNNSIGYIKSSSLDDSVKEIFRIE